MTTSTNSNERRDWTLLIFIIPIGVILMLIAGQIAIRLAPSWNINADMQSNLDPGNLPKQENGPVQPVLPAILTPLGWLDTFLTPGTTVDDQNNVIVFPPFVVFEPSSTPAVTLPPPTAATTLPPPATTPPTSPPTVVTSPPTSNTSKPPDNPPPATSTTVVPTATTPSVTATTPSPTAIGTPVTPPVTIAVTPPPQLGINVPPNGNDGGGIPVGTYVVIHSNIDIVVNSTPDGKYDLIYYEIPYSGDPTHYIQMDNVIVGISQFNDGSYYEVFNWGDNDPDHNKNTNVDTDKLPPDSSCTSSPPECDNRYIPITSLYGSTGILIDVDTASGAPPPGIYNYIVIISPVSSDPANVDSIVVAEIAGGPSPMVKSEKAAPSSEGSGSTSLVGAADPPANDPAPPAENSDPPPADSVSPPSNNDPAPPADSSGPSTNDPAPPADNAPAQ